MAPEDIVKWTLFVEGIALSVLVVWFLGHGLLLQRYKRWSQPLLDQAREALTVALDNPSRGRELLEPFRKLPIRLQIRLFSELLPTLSGEQKQWLTNLGRELRLTTRAERQCRSRLWWRRLRGARLITLLGAREAVMLPLLVDRNPYVRAQAAEWAVNRPDAATVDILLALLSDPDGWCRFAVQDSLLRMGGNVLDRLVVYLSTHAGHEVKAPLQIAINIADPRLLPPAITLTRDHISEIRALAATLLGSLGGAQATEVLTALLTDADPAVCASATRALGKLSHWPAAATVASLLRDQVWEVRKEAGLALAALGAPGVLFLNRALKGSDPSAADMARHVLDLTSHA
ncbi:MAG: HEAT repeat domain-containing protein [Deltaproteobacteria bacterium]|nr:HEAT repeat domain-containing protein [Deltaproteobacteria bacterium]